MIDADVLARMYSQIVQGKSKDESTIAATDEEHSQAWDTIAAEAEAMRADGVEFEIPADQPDTVTDLFAGMKATAPEGEEPEPEVPESEPAEEPEEEATDE